MWKDLDIGFQAAFEQAWHAYGNNTIPIGTAILNKENIVMSTGRNQIDSKGDGIISLHQLAHGEINAILKLSEITDQNIHNHIRTFTLYSTMEPCPLCFGAIVMGSIKNVKYAARDSYAGATALNKTMDYIKNKNISVLGPFEELEVVQIAMQTCFELENKFSRNIIIESWRQVCPKGVQVGKHLFNEHILKDMRNKSFEEVFNYITDVSV